MYDEVVKRRLRGMISYIRGTRRRPVWIKPQLWERMLAYWNTDDAIKRSSTASASRNSPRDGLGRHIYVGGPKSQVQIQHELSIAEGREVSLGEVFIKTRTKKNGTIPDQKAKKIYDDYEANLAKQSQLSGGVSSVSDGASQTAQLTVAEQNAIFMKSTMVDGRGKPYGLGSLSRVIGKEKGVQAVDKDSPVIIELQKQLKSAKSELRNQRREHISGMELLVKYLGQKDPNLPPWIQALVPTNVPTATPTDKPAAPTLPDQGEEEATDGDEGDKENENEDEDVDEDEDEDDEDDEENDEEQA